MKLTDAIQRDLDDHRVITVFAGRDTVAIWNKKRGHGDPPIFTGWYWMRGHSEGGPFRCESAAMRDAWYRVVRNENPPPLFTTRDIMSNIVPLRGSVRR